MRGFFFFVASLLNWCISSSLDIAQLDWGTLERGSWHGGEPDPWAFQQHSLCAATFLAHAGHRIRPPSALTHVMFSFMSYLPFNAPKRGNKFSPPCLTTFTSHAISLSFFSFGIISERINSVILQPLSSHLVHLGRVSFLFGQLTARHGWAFRVSYQTESLSYAWCAPDLATVRVHTAYFN